MTAKNYEAWKVKEADYPSEKSTEEKLKFLIRYAILAPSGPNTQPWKFAVSTNNVSVYADLSRSLPFVDPSNRTLYMSVGCALANLLVAGEHFGFRPDLAYFPRGQKSDLVADIKFEKGSGPEGEDLFPQITRRCTIKHMFDEKDIEPSILKELESYIEPGFYLSYMTDKAEKAEMADLVSRAHHAQLANRDFRRNLGDWLKPNWTTEYDGMPLYTFGVPDWVSIGFPAAFKEFDLSEAVIYRDSGLINGCSAIGILSSDQDDKLTWARCGAMLERFLLKATSYDIRLSFFSQPIGLPELRKELRDEIGKGHPLLVFSLGYSTPLKHTPRRPLEDVLIEQ